MTTITEITAENWETALLNNHGFSVENYLPEGYAYMPEEEAWAIAGSTAETITELLGKPNLYNIVEEQVFEHWEYDESYT